MFRLLSQLKLFVLSFKNNAHRISLKNYFLLTVETKYYNVVTEGRNFFDQSVKTHKKTTAQKMKFFIKGLFNHKLIAIDLSKETSFDADPEATQQFSFTENLGLNATLILILEKLKETILYFQQEAVRVM